MSDEVCFSEVHSASVQSQTEKIKTRFLLNLPLLEYQNPDRHVFAPACIENHVVPHACIENHEVPPACIEIHEVPPACIDRDGDLDVCRRDTRYNLAVTISHSNTSTLPLAGLQVWSGSLLMCDFLLSNPVSIQEHVIVELGSGTGLTAVIAAHLASVVFATDNSSYVLSQCRDNIVSNQSISLPYSAKVHVGLLDWRRGYFPCLEDSPLLQEFVFSPTQRELLAISDVILACDTVYDTAGVEDFISCIHKLITETLTANKIKLYLSLERRINFSLSTLSAGSEPYDVLFSGLEKLRSTLTHVSVTWCRVVLEQRQRVEYERSEYLQLWVVSFEKMKV